MNKFIKRINEGERFDNSIFGYKYNKYDIKGNKYKYPYLVLSFSIKHIFLIKFYRTILNEKYFKFSFLYD